MDETEHRTKTKELKIQENKGGETYKFTDNNIRCGLSDNITLVTIFQEFHIILKCDVPRHI